jgi:exodeoxyribonuclease VII large subunit
MAESILVAPGAADTGRLNLPEYTVSELSAAVKRSLEQGFSYVRVRGEISGFKRHGSGHCYLSLKDAEAQLDGVIWRMTAQRMSLKPEDGMEVVCTGRITTFASRSKYQLVIESMELAGVGALLKMLEDRRKRLAAEGLFDASRKRPLPYLPEVIGVVTSPTGAVIRDILHRLADRFPRRVLLWPVPVQGEGAAERVAAAIEGFNRLPERGPVPRPDLLIVARGGGSLEDLMAFNEEIVVRAAAASKIPLISAVGHETDTTLIDHASDRRAPTPTAAAEIAVPVRLELLAQVGNAGGRMAGAMVRLLDERRLRVVGLGRGLLAPGSLLEAAAQRLDDRAERLGNGLQQFLRVKRDRLSALADRVRPEALREQLRQAGERLAALPERMAHAVRRALEREQQRIHALEGRLESHRQAIRNVLARGYVLVWGPDGKVVVSADAIPPGARLGLQFHDGKAEVVAEGPRKRKPKPTSDSPQGELL